MAKPVFKELLERQTAVTKIVGYLVAGFFGTVLLIIYSVFDVKGPLITFSSIFIIGILANMALFYLHKKIFLTYQILIVLSYLEIVVLTCFTGGINSPAVFVLTIFPVAAFSTSQKQGTLWSIVALLTILILFKADALGVPIERGLSGENLSLFSLASVLFVLASVVVISYMVNRSTFAVHRAFDRDSKELAEKRKRLENLTTLLNYSTDLMCVIDLKTLIIEDLNPIFKVVLGYELSEVRGKEISRFLKKDKSTMSLESDFGSMKEDQVIEFDAQMICKDGAGKAFSWIGIAKNGKLHASARETNSQ